MDQETISSALGMEDEEILDNIDGRMNGPMSSFVEKYFGHFQYIQRDATLEIRSAGKVLGRHTIPADVPSPDGFLRWFSDYISQELDSTQRSWHIFRRSEASELNSNHHDASLLFTQPAQPAPSAVSSGSGVDIKWDHVQVIGQFSDDNVCYRDGLVRLSRSASHVFASQPMRLFLHGFYICGSLIELWIFDRSGLYCSEVFDIRENCFQFLSIILTYQAMTDSELGRNNMTIMDINGSYIMREATATPSLKLYLENKPIASREKLVGTGTTCYRAKSSLSDEWSHAVKFKWRWVRHRSEDEILTKVQQKRVWGAISLEYYKEFESTADLRQGLRWGPHKQFSKMRPPEKCDVDGFIGYTEETDNFFQNRILTCIVTSPVGRPLHTFRSRLELLQVFRDAIRCHRSLYHDAEILHQDISSGNIIILDGQGESKPKGILIDLDSAVEHAGEAVEDHGIVGTRPFMAIGVLKSERHTYRHDLESFLYVLLWTIISNHGENLPETSKLGRWSNGSWDVLATRKILDMGQDKFQEILGEFETQFHALKPLVEAVHRLLFPLRDGVIWTGTDSSQEATDRLYGGMMGEFEKAITYMR